MSIPPISAYPMPQPADLPANKVNWQPETRRAVLLVHDMQDYFLRFYGADSALRAALVENIAALCAWARAAGVPVVYTAQPLEQSAEQRALLNDMWGPGLSAADPVLQRITPGLAPQAQDTVLVKWRYSAFQRADLEARMRAWGRDQLLICGVYAHIGCMTTALDAFMRDIQAFMVGDALADFGADDHLMALRYVAGRCGSVTHTAALLAARPRLDIAWLRACIEQRVDEQGFGPDDNLVDYGLDSIKLMALLAEWEKLGLRVGFEELAGTPTLNAWWDVVRRKLAA